MLKYRILQALVAFVYKQVDERRYKTLEEIITKNDGAFGVQRYVFNYAGKRWTQHRFKGVPQNVPYLEDSLHPAMDEYIAEGRLIELTEKPMVEAFIRAILNSHQDPIMAMLNIPTALQHPIREAMDEVFNVTGKRGELDFEQCQEVVGAYGPAADTIRRRMMFNMMVE